jgi:hypothetical protein
VSRRCHLCLATVGLVQGRLDRTLWFCRDTAWCNYGARLRLGIPRHGSGEGPPGAAELLTRELAQRMRTR